MPVHVIPENATNKVLKELVMIGFIQSKGGKNPPTRDVEPKIWFKFPMALLKRRTSGFLAYLSAC